MLFGYARVSTDDQNLHLQHDALRVAGCERVFEDLRADRARDIKEQRLAAGLPV